MRTLIYKIPPDLPFPKGGTIPLFGNCLLLSKAATQNYSILTANITKQGNWFLRNKAISCIDPPAFRMLGFRNQLFIKGLIIE